VVETADRPVALAIQEVLTDVRAGTRTHRDLGVLGLHRVQVPTVGAETPANHEVSTDLPQ